MTHWHTMPIHCYTILPRNDPLSLFKNNDKALTILEKASSDGRVVSGTATDWTLSLTIAWVWIPAWACEKVASDLGLGGGFRRVLWFPPLSTTGFSRISHNWHKCDEKWNSKVWKERRWEIVHCKSWVFRSKDGQGIFYMHYIRRQIHTSPFFDLSSRVPHQHRVPLECQPFMWGTPLIMPRGYAPCRVLSIQQQSSCRRESLKAIFRLKKTAPWWTFDRMWHQPEVQSAILQ